MNEDRTDMTKQTCGYENEQMSWFGDSGVEGVEGVE